MLAEVHWIALFQWHQPINYIIIVLSIEYQTARLGSHQVISILLQQAVKSCKKQASHVNVPISSSVWPISTIQSQPTCQLTLFERIYRSKLYLREYNRSNKPQKYDFQVRHGRNSESSSEHKLSIAMRVFIHDVRFDLYQTYVQLRMDGRVCSQLVHTVGDSLPLPQI